MSIIGRRELRVGAFVRSIALPAGVQGDQAKASYKNGFLEIRLRRASGPSRRQ